MCCVEIFVFIYVISAASSQNFWECHDDPETEHEEGPLYGFSFSWLGVLQYVHVKNGTPHYFRAPRVSLISRQFVLTTAQDAARIPEDYALGNVVFGDYERDETECKLTVDSLADGAFCDPAVLLMPIADVLLHPEYIHFGVRSSIALLKLLKPVVSSYAIPVCLPIQNFINSAGRVVKDHKLHHIDFSADVPRDFVNEGKEIRFIKLIPKEVCYHDASVQNQSLSKERMMCSTSCNFRSGAVTLVHEHTGHWAMLAISEGGTPCPDPLVSRKAPSPPRHILIYPYVSWITAAISGKPITGFAKDDPFGYIMPRSQAPVVFDYDTFMHGWNGHWWMGGARCYDRGDNAIDLFRFYHEIFQIKPVSRTLLTYYLEIDAVADTLITCVKVGMPFRLGQPRVWALETPSVKVYVPVIYVTGLFSFQVEAFAYNETSLSSSSSSESDMS